jgi:hypothetical protein
MATVNITAFWPLDRGPRSPPKSPKLGRSLGRNGALLAALTALASSTFAAGWLPPGLPPAPAEGPALCPADYLTPAQGQAVLEAALAQFPDAAAWEQYRSHVRRRIQEAVGLQPWPRRTPLHARSHSLRHYDGYSVENVAFESVPGYFVTGNLYRPRQTQGRVPAVLNTHGHTPRVTGPDDYARHGRFRPDAQARAALLARQGAVVLAIDMFGYGDSIEQVGQDAHRSPLAMTIQLWNARRALDYLEELAEVDPQRIAVTGESGGGTQAFLLTAVDDRVAVSVPVVMVSSYFFGGCPCESGRPIHRSDDHFVSNAMLAAFAVPRPQLVISNGKDWTRHVPEIEYPFLREVYRRFGAVDQVANVHLPDEGHDYGPSKRAAALAFLATHLGLEPPPRGNDPRQLDERAVTVEPPERMRVFTAAYPLPDHALPDAAAVEQALRQLIRD